MRVELQEQYHLHLRPEDIGNMFYYLATLVAAN